MDDIIISENYTEVVNALVSKFRAKDMGEMRNFLGTEITKQETNHSISQERMIDKIINKFNTENYKTAITPMETNFQIDTDLEKIQVPFKELIGSIMYAAVTSNHI